MSENKITFPVKLASNNPQSFGIVDAMEVSGHRSVDTLSDLYAISDPVLSVLKDGSDAIGQEWFVVSEDCRYRLDNWGNRKSVSGWTKLPKQEFVNTKQSVSEKDQPNGYAGLDSSGKLPIEKTYGTTATVVDVATYESLPVTGLSGVIYYVSNTSAQYKWSGSAYIDITDGADNAKKNETSIFDCSNGTSTKYYSSLSEAINVVPPAYRTSNRIISYLSTENSTTSAVNYQYHGIDSTTWTDLTKWEHIPNQADLAQLYKALSDDFQVPGDINENGQIAHVGSGWYSTDFIPVVEGQKVTGFVYSGEGLTLLAYYDVNKNFISRVETQGSVLENKTINLTIPSGVCYVKTSTWAPENYNCSIIIENYSASMFKGLDVAKRLSQSENNIKIIRDLNGGRLPIFDNVTNFSPSIQEIYLKSVLGNEHKLRIYKDSGNDHRTGIAVMNWQGTVEDIDLCEYFSTSEEALAAYNSEHLYINNGNYVLAYLALSNISGSYVDDNVIIQAYHTNDISYAPVINTYINASLNNIASKSITQKNNAFGNNFLNTIIPYFVVNKDSSELANYDKIRIYKNINIDGIYVTGIQFISNEVGYQDYPYCILSKEPLDVSNPHFGIEGLEMFIDWDSIPLLYDYGNITFNASASAFKSSLKEKKIVDGAFGCLNGNSGYIENDESIVDTDIMSYTHKLYVGNAKYLRIIANAAGNIQFLRFYDKSDNCIFSIKPLNDNAGINKTYNTCVKIPCDTDHIRITSIYLGPSSTVATNFSNTFVTLFSDDDIVLPNSTLLIHEVYDSNDKGYDYIKTGTITAGNDGLTLAAGSSYKSGYYFAATNRTMRILCKFSGYDTYYIGNTGEWIDKIPFIISSNTVSVSGISKNYELQIGEWHWITFETNYNYQHSCKITITNVHSGDSVDYTIENELTDYPYIEAGTSNSITIKQLDVVEAHNKPYIMFYGDSISAMAQSWDWETLMEEHITLPCIRSGRGGTQIRQIAERIQQEVGRIHPKFVLIGIGTNGGNNYSILANLVEYVRAIGAVPYLNHVPCGSNPIRSNIQIEINAVIDQVRADYNVKGIDFDKATSLSGDGLAIDPVCFPEREGDYVINTPGYMLHPGAIGCKRMLQQAFIDAPELFNS